MTLVKKISLDQTGYPPAYPQYVLDLHDIFVCPNGIVLDSDYNLIPEASFNWIYWGTNFIYDNNIDTTVASSSNTACEKSIDAYKKYNIVDLEDQNYVYALHYFDLYVYGHLWDVLQPLQKLESIVDKKILLINSDTGHVVNLTKHFKLFGYEKTDCFTCTFENKSIYRLQKLWVPSMAAYASRLSSNTIEWLRGKYALDPDKLPKLDSTRLFLARKGTRFLLNEKEVRETLEPLGFVFLLGDTDLAYTIQMFEAAEVIVGVHGAAFKNMLFCTKCKMIIEYCPSNRPSSDFKEQAALQKIPHKWILTQADKDYNININIEELKSLLRRFYEKD